MDWVLGPACWGRQTDRQTETETAGRGKEGGKEKGMDYESEVRDRC